MALRKIDLMHHLYGQIEGKKCSECCHLQSGRYHDTILHKCELYGLTHSEASDWRLKYTACGLFNKETDVRNVISKVVPDRRPIIHIGTISGQKSLFEMSQYRDELCPIKAYRVTGDFPELNASAKIGMVVREQEDKFVLESLGSFIQGNLNVEITKEELLAAVTIFKKLVFCKDCKYGDMEFEGKCYLCRANWHRDGSRRRMMPYEFCSSGKRRDGGRMESL